MNRYEKQRILRIIEQARKEGATKLNLSDERITELPAEIGQLTNLSKLSLYKNKLSSLPAEIGQLTNLTRLSLYNNKLSSLPAEIGKLTRLKTLDLSNNQLSKLPPQMTQLTNLKSLDLSGNPLPIPPEILWRTRKPAAILAYYFREHKTPLNEAKVVLVGQGGVGKSSLVKRLVEDKFDLHEPITKGIDIRGWDVTINQEQVRVNIWDFGGQEIMHATHQFFLTERTLYLLVLDARQGKNASRFSYWLELISSFGADSPILVVSNKIDQHQLGFDKRDLGEKYPSIKGFVNTSCKSGEGIGQLKKQIRGVIDELEHVRDLIPMKWLTIKAKLEELHQHYIPYREYVRLCESHDVHKKQEQRVLIRLLHDLGVVLHFQDDVQLRETVVLNPQWVTGAVYQIINAKPLQNKGVLEIGQLGEILDAHTYPQERYLLIIEMMRRFERCFDLEGYVGERFLVPDLLPAEEPQIPFWPSDGLDIEYRYNFLPRSVISRFIGQMHGFIFRDHCWRSGVVLVKDKNNALVKASIEERKITISVIGNKKRDFLSQIRDKFERIHHTISSLEAVEHVCVAGGVIPYQALKQAHQTGMREYPLVDQNGKFVPVNVESLLAKFKRTPTEQKDAAIEQLFNQLRQQSHPQLFYESGLSFGREHYAVGAYSLARQALAVTHQALRDLRRMESKNEAQVNLSQVSAELYGMLAHCCVEEQHFVRAFEYATIAKGRAFVNQLAKSRLDFEALDHQEGFADKLKQVRQLREQVEDNRQSMQANAARENLPGKQFKLIQQERERWREMEHEYPALTATLTVPSLSAEQARALASELDATLVEYYRHSGGWCAFVVTKDSIRYEALSDVNDNLLNLLVSWRNNVHTGQGRSRRRLRLLDRLHEAMVAPLGIKSRRVIFAPFRELHLLPLWAARQKISQRYLVEDHVVSYIPSLTALYVVNQEQKRRQSSQVFERLLSVAYPGTPALPNVLKEAQAIANRLSGRATVHGLHEQLATPENVLKWAPDYDVIHFGCHGNVQSADPTQWGLQLVKPLTISQIITKLDLKRTQLTTLAACLTGEVALREGEEHIGLLQAIMTAGVPTVVASLWSVDDTATRVLFEAFYSRLAMGYAAQEAMRDACKWLRGVHKSWQHPFFWASFAVNGLVLPTQPKVAQSEQWPPTELAAKIDHYTPKSIQHRGEIMKNQLIEEAKLLLHDLLYDREEVLQAFQKHPLSPAVAKKKVVNDRELAFAQALYLIVEDNPALQDFLPPEEEMTQLRNYNLFKRAMSSSQPKPSVTNKLVENSVSDFYEPLKEMLREKRAQTTRSQTSSTN